MLIAVARQHSCRAVRRQHAVSDATRRLSNGSALAAGHGGERRVQEPALALRPDAARRRGIHCLRLVLTARNITAK